MVVEIVSSPFTKTRKLFDPEDVELYPTTKVVQR